MPNQRPPPTLTDRILALTASGDFGVAEAIAYAKQQIASDRRRILHAYSPRTHIRRRRRD